MIPFLFILAINCRFLVFFRGRDKPPFRAVVFPFPYDPNPFPRTARGQAPETPRLSLESNHSHGAGRASRTERCKTFAPSGARPSHRAVQDLRTEWDATTVPSETRPSSRAGRTSRARRLERLEQPDTVPAKTGFPKGEALWRREEVGRGLRRTASVASRRGGETAST